MVSGKRTTALWTPNSGLRSVERVPRLLLLFDPTSFLKPRNIPKPEMPMTQKPTIDYDQNTDVLYINVQPGKPADSGLEDKDGRIWRYDADEKLVGVTILNFVEDILRQLP